jgi:hypothetical protein
MHVVRVSSFARLADYITDDLGKHSRIVKTEISNCVAATYRATLAEVMATQMQNTRAKGDKTYHLLVSFRVGERPDNKTLTDIEKQICDVLGFGEHQRISAVHNDTDNLHIHIAINKVHPIRKTLREPYKAYLTLAEICKKIEIQYGLERDNHGSVRSVSEGKANDMERHSGVESLISWIRRKCLTDILAAKSWDEMYATMRTNGLRMEVRGNGLVIWSDDGTAVKASSVNRGLSKSALEKKFGGFEAPASLEPEETVAENTSTSGVSNVSGDGKAVSGTGNEPRNRRYEKHPIKLSVDTSVLYAQYQAERERSYVEWPKVFSKLQDGRDSRVKAILRSFKLRRQIIKLIDCSYFTKRMLYQQAYRSMKRKLESARLDYQEERLKKYASYRRRTWADWLKAQAMAGNVQALAVLRSREGGDRLSGSVLTGDGKSGQPNLLFPNFFDNITKKGVVIYRAAGTLLRDDGSKIHVPGNATMLGMEAGLLLTMQRFGNIITVNGDAKFKAKVVFAAVKGEIPITFSDPALEARRNYLLWKVQKNDQRETGKQDRQWEIEFRGGRTGQRGVGRVDSRTREVEVGRSVLGTQERTTAIARDARRKRPSSFLYPRPPFVGRQPEAQNSYSMRTLRESHVAYYEGRGEMLLPDHAHVGLEHEGSVPNRRVRRPVSDAIVDKADVRFHHIVEPDPKPGGLNKQSRKRGK